MFVVSIHIQQEGQLSNDVKDRCKTSISPVSARLSLVWLDLAQSGSTGFSLGLMPRGKTSISVSDQKTGVRTPVWEFPGPGLDTIANRFGGTPTMGIFSARLSAER